MNHTKMEEMTICRAQAILHDMDNERICDREKLEVIEVLCIRDGHFKVVQKKEMLNAIRFLWKKLCSE